MCIFCFAYLGKIMNQMRFVIAYTFELKQKEYFIISPASYDSHRCNFTRMLNDKDEDRTWSLINVTYSHEPNLWEVQIHVPLIVCMHTCRYTGCIGRVVLGTCFCVCMFYSFSANICLGLWLINNISSRDKYFNSL